ncbi:N(G),N(G)-dimethylarginine dimethylaminohydrolase [Pilimelia anulata]|uniref:N(G),N(G)-dimethylarginine dimethylaminohydrolase n=1 Tax=Pilimelia anulata TaxID=53371 RepID=A0A8J3F9L2_9ACTN|nr:dimethylargininase [Pilimelia anulata]GGJ87667.1 N(G),N(G)-dimethylarginine dimethylaminohydrolase [Pilimelia anulata]
MTRRVALLRRPSPLLADGLVTHVDRRPVDPALALDQWTAYAAALTAHGWTTLEVPPLDACPDGVFVEDAVVVYGDLAVLLRSGAPSRRPETAGLADALEPFGYLVATVADPATADGGDVLKHGDRVWIGASGRTNAAGVARLTDLLAARGATVSAVPVSRVLHLKSAVTALPDGTILGHPPLVDDPAAWGTAFLPVPEPAGAHVVVLDERTVLLSAAAPRTAELLAGRGLAVVPVDISEFEKREGSVTCLSVRLR